MVTKITTALFREVKAELTKGDSIEKIAKKHDIGVSTVKRIKLSGSLKEYKERYSGRSQAQVKKAAEKQLEKDINKVLCPKLDIKSVKEHLEMQISNTRGSVMSLVDDIVETQTWVKIAIALASIALVLAVIK